MTRWAIVIGLVSIVLLAHYPCEAAVTFYGAAYSTTMPSNTQLVTVDPETGEITRIGDPMSNPNRLHGLVMTNDAELYGINGFNGSFYSVDLVTGQPTLIGATGYLLAWGLAYDPATDTIYGLGRPNSSSTVNRLLTFDRTTGAVTPIGPGTTGMTGTSGIGWDTLNSRVLAFDNSDAQFYAFDTSGNGTFLSVASPIVSTWAVAYDGEHVVMQLQGFEDNRKMAYYDPDTGLRVGDLLTLSEWAPMEALDFVATPLIPDVNQWDLTHGDSYNEPSHWTQNTVPNAVDAVARFLGSITADSIVTVNQPVTLGTIEFDNAEYSYTLAGPTPINLERSGGSPQINVYAGHHTISAKLLPTDGLVIYTEADSGLTVDVQSTSVVLDEVTKQGGGTCLFTGGLAVKGPLNVEGGTLELAEHLLALPGGEVNVAEGATLITSGHLTRFVRGSGRLSANGSLAVGVLSSTDGFDFDGTLEVGPHMVGLVDADMAKVHAVHLGGSGGGGTLASFNGIALQPVDVWATMDSHDGWVTGHGTIRGAVHLEVDTVTGDFAAIAGDGPDDLIVMDGIVTGSGWLEYVQITGLHRPGASAGFTGLGQGTNIGPGATLVGIDGPHGFWTPDPSEKRGYDQWFAMFGEHAISGDLTIKLEAPTPGGEIYMPDSSVRYEIFKSYAPGGNPANAGWYVGWFNNVTLDPAWPNPTQWVWEFDYKEGGLGHGAAPDPGRAFYSATLMVVPEPGTLVMLLSGGLGLLAFVWRRGRRHLPA